MKHLIKYSETKKIPFEKRKKIKHQLLFLGFSILRKVICVIFGVSKKKWLDTNLLLKRINPYLQYRLYYVEQHCCGLKKQF